MTRIHHLDPRIRRILFRHMRSYLHPTDIVLLSSDVQILHGQFTLSFRDARFIFSIDAANRGLVPRQRAGVTTLREDAMMDIVVFLGEPRWERGGLAGADPFGCFTDGSEVGFPRRRVLGEDEGESGFGLYLVSL